MRNVTIFGNFTILETFTLNYVNIDKGYDDHLEVFYRLNLYIEDNEDVPVNMFQDYYYCPSLDEDMSHLQKLKN